MTLRQLEYLITVAEEGSFTRAAERLFVSQPALSHQIKAFEKSVGGELLERLPNAVNLTPMGRAFLPHPRNARRPRGRRRASGRARRRRAGGRRAADRDAPLDRPRRRTGRDPRL